MLKLKFEFYYWTFMFDDEPRWLSVKLKYEARRSKLNLEDAHEVKDWSLIWSGLLKLMLEDEVWSRSLKYMFEFKS